MASYRLNNVAKELNVGIKTLVEYLAKKGHQVSAAPNTKISKVQYELLATAFQGDKKVKESSLQEKIRRPQRRRINVNSENTEVWHPTPRYQGRDSQNTRKDYGSAVKPVRIGRK